MDSKSLSRRELLAGSLGAALATGALSSPARSAEASVPDGLSGDRAMETLREIFAIGPRWAGHEGCTKAGEFMERLFGAAGLDGVERQFGASMRWVPKEYALTVATTEGPWLAESLFPHRYTPALVDANGGVTTKISAPFAYVGLGHAADFDTQDVAGRFVLSEVQDQMVSFGSVSLGLRPGQYAMPAASKESIVNEAKARGALAVVLIEPRPGNTPRFVGKHKDPDLLLAAFFVGNEDGARLHDFAESGLPATLLYDGLTERIPDDDPHRPFNVVGRLPGRDSSGEYIVFCAHYDSPWAGASDNASGMAGLIELAHYYGARPGSTKRDLVFVATYGHHESSESLDKTKPFASLRDFFSTRNLDKMALLYNIDHIGAEGYDVVWDGAPHEPAGLARQLAPKEYHHTGGHEMSFVIAPYQKPILVELALKAMKANGLTRIVPAPKTAAGGIGPVYAFRTRGINITQQPPWYHTLYDTLEPWAEGHPPKINPLYIEQFIRGTRDFIAEIDAMSLCELEPEFPT